MNYAEALAWLYATQDRGIKLGLENVRRLLGELGWHGQRSAAFLHVAGTNGKGSVCAMLDAVCRAAGFRTGLFTSPHLVTLSRAHPDQWRNDRAGKNRRRADARSRDRARVGNASDIFRSHHRAGARHFQTEGAQIVVLETGMGGRLDATNVVTPAASVITAIDLDHQAWLGSTLREIAREKAGIIKPGVPVVTLPQSADAAEVLRETARRQKADFSVVGQALENVPLALAGSHQKLHAALAVAALRSARIKASDAAIRKGLRNVSWPGRFQRIGARVILDGAHNPAAARRLAETWREEFGSEQATVIFGSSKDKAIAEVCAALAPITAVFIATPMQNPRAADPGEIRAALCIKDIRCVAAENLPHALELATARTERILITGSFFLVGEALAQLGIASSAPEVSAQ